VNDENACPYCKEPDSILHTFVECQYTQAFFVKVVDWFNLKLNCGFSPTPLETLFGTDLPVNTSRNNELKFNYCLLFAKYYLYYQKMYCKTCNFTEFVLNLEQKLLIESRLKRKLAFYNNVLCSTTLFFCIILVLPFYLSFTQSFVSSLSFFTVLFKNGVISVNSVLFFFVSSVIVNKLINFKKNVFLKKKIKK